jgi:hypothetical protein
METIAKEIKSKINRTNPDKNEGYVASMIEEQTARIPSDVYLWAALGAMGTSLTLQLLGRNHTALFIGQWAPSFLLLGIYNKLVKQLGHDSADRE